MSPQALQGFWSKMKIKNPKIVEMSPTVFTKYTNQKEVIWQQYSLCLAIAEYQILDGKHFLILGPESGKIWWLKKVQYLQKKYHCQWTSCAARNPSGFFIILVTYYNRLSLYRLRVNGSVLGDCISKSHLISIRAQQYRQYILISDFLDLVNLSIREEAILAANWIKDQPEGLKLQNLALATMTGPAVRTFPKDMTADVQYALDKCESLGSWKQLILHGNPSALAEDFSPRMSVLRCHFLPNMQFQCCMILQGTLGSNFDIFAASGESTAWVLLWKTRSRPIGVRVCPVAQFNFFSTAWTMVVFWKESVGRQPQLITPENEGGDNTNYPSPPT